MRSIPTPSAAAWRSSRSSVRAAGPAANDLYDRIVGRVERELIQQVMQTCDRIQIKAAARLGINRNTLHKKLSEFRLDDTSATAGMPPDNDNGDGDGHGPADDGDEALYDHDQPRPGAGAPAPPADED